MEQTLTMTKPSLRLLTVKEAVETLRISTPTVYRYIDSGELRAKLSPRKTFITEEDLVAFIDSKYSYIRGKCIEDHRFRAAKRRLRQNNHLPQPGRGYVRNGAAGSPGRS